MIKFEQYFFQYNWNWISFWGGDLIVTIIVFIPQSIHQFITAIIRKRIQLGNDFFVDFIRFR